MRLTPLVLIRAALLLVASWSIAAPAGAVPVEELVQVAVHPDAPDVIVARYLNGGDGLLVSRNGGQTFQLACAALVDREEVGQNNPIAVGADGTLFVRSYSGLWRDDRSACSFQRESVFEGLWVSDMVTDPLDGRRMYAVTSGVDGDQLHGLYVREPDGNWSVVGNHEPKLVIHRLRVAATEAFS